MATSEIDDFEDIVGQPTDKVEMLLDGRDTPNLLFWGPPGTGKTTTARLVGQRLSRNPEFVPVSERRQHSDVVGYISEMGRTDTVSGDARVIILDELDYMNPDGQRALRSVMDRSHSVWIATCNDFDQVIDPIKSRFLSLEFDRLHFDDMFELAQRLNEDRGLSLERGKVRKAAKAADGDARQVLNQMLLER